LQQYALAHWVLADGFAAIRTRSFCVGSNNSSRLLSTTQLLQRFFQWRFLVCVCAEEELAEVCLLVMLWFTENLFVPPQNGGFKAPSAAFFTRP